MQWFAKYSAILLLCVSSWSSCLGAAEPDSEAAEQGSVASFLSGFDTSPDFFEPFPYFPDFGDVFRIPTTQPPAGHRFSDFNPESANRPSGRRRPTRRPPRPASSRAKASKQVAGGDPPDKARTPKNGKPTSGKSTGKPRNYPKIFRFTSDRVNLADFDSKKKTNDNYLTLNKGDDLDSDKVKRTKFLILHGGVFEIEKSGRLLHTGSASGEVPFYALGSEPAGEEVKLDEDQYLYKTQ